MRVLESLRLNGQTVLFSPIGFFENFFKIKNMILIMRYGPISWEVFVRKNISFGAQCAIFSFLIQVSIPILSFCCFLLL